MNSFNMIILLVIVCATAVACSARQPNTDASSEATAIAIRNAQPATPESSTRSSSSLSSSQSESAMTTPANATTEASTEGTMLTAKLDTATFGAGCFWCVEAVFQRLDGVAMVASGYAGGKKANPSYREVCTGETGHAEVCQITYDPKKLSFVELLEVFWQTHDPTTLNRQGADAGTQYRSVVFYHNETQRKLAEEYKKKLSDAKVWSDPIVTEISPLTAFYKAEDYHQNYFNDNGSQPYCSIVIRPKLEKFEKVFKAKMKKSTAKE